MLVLLCLFVIIPVQHRSKTTYRIVAIRKTFPTFFYLSPVTTSPRTTAILAQGQRSSAHRGVELLITAVTLAIVPYVLLRGPISPSREWYSPPDLL